MNALARLEKWNNGKKSRAVNIERGNGYGATCWEVTLWEGFSKLVCREAKFWNYKEGIDPGWMEHEGNLFTVVPGYDDEDWDWPGLEATINHAIDCAEKFWKDDE